MSKTYEQIRASMAQEVINASKFAISPDHAKVWMDRGEMLEISLDQANSILKQFEQQGSVRIISAPSEDYMTVSYGDPYDEDPQKYYELDVLNEKHIDQFIPRKPMTKKQFQAMLNPFGLMDDDDQPKEIHYKETVKEVPSPKFFIDWKDDRRIMLNGKIDIGKPDFDGPNERIFQFLYEHSNQAVTFKDLEENAKASVKTGQELRKTLESLGFRRGIGAAFFDIGKDSVKFKNPVEL